MGIWLGVEVWNAPLVCFEGDGQQAPKLYINRYGKSVLMGAKSYVSRWGSSLAIRIPKSIAEQWGVQEGSAIEIIPRGDQVVLRKETYDLASMLAQVQPDSLHPEQAAGPAQDSEEC